MNRLQSELHRLFLLPGGTQLLGPSGEVRALVIELAHPADWRVLSVAWRAVQTDLELPAPAIAVSGTEGLQLWFSLAEAVNVSRAAEFLDRLRARYLVGIAPARVRLMPSATTPPQHAALVPALQEATGNWSAFVAPDLAPVFADTPWLDIPPGADGQADLLARLESIKPEAFDAAMQSLLPTSSPTAPQPSPPDVPPSVTAANARSSAADVDPRHFLQQVLNDETAPLALRLQAATALLRAADAPPARQAD